MRILNVKEVFAESLIRLAQKKDFSKITVQNIIDEAHSSRRTFYNHFSDKYDLMNWIYGSRSQEILECFRVSKEWVDCVIDMYQVVENDKEYYKNISTFTGQNSFAEFLYHYCRKVFVEYIQNAYGKDVLTDELLYAVDHHCYGIAYTVVDWIRTDFKVPAEIIARWQYDAMPLQLKQYMQ